jgi:hypothetical protein
MVHVKKEWVVGALMASLIVVAVTGLWVMGRVQSAGRVGFDRGANDPGPSAPREKWHGPVPSVVAERFIKAKTHEERLEWVRHPEEVGAAMKAFFREGPGATEQIGGLHPLATESSGDLVYESYGVEINGSPDRLLSVSVDPRGAKVDFECYARLGSVAWADLTSGKVTEAAELRAVLQPGGYFLNVFADEQKWLHFKASSPDGEETVDFYLDRGHPLVREIQQIEGPLFRATLSVRAVNGSERHGQFEISSVKALDWVEPG